MRTNKIFISLACILCAAVFSGGYALGQGTAWTDLRDYDRLHRAFHGDGGPTNYKALVEFYADSPGSRDKTYQVVGSALVQQRTQDIVPLLALQAMQNQRIIELLEEQKGRSK